MATGSGIFDLIYKGSGDIQITAKPAPDPELMQRPAFGGAATHPWRGGRAWSMAAVLIIPGFASKLTSILSVRPAPLTFRAKVVSWRTCLTVEHRMAPALRAAPKSRPASFRNPSHQIVGIANKSGGDSGAGRGCKTKSQRDDQKGCPNHPILLPALIKLERFTDRIGNRWRRYHLAREKQSTRLFGSGTV